MRRFPTLLAFALVVVLSPAAGPSGQSPSIALAASSPSPSPAPKPGQRRPADSNPHTWQTSDRIVGPSRPSMPSYARAVTRTRQRFEYQVRPGVRISSYQQHVGARSIRYFVVRANYKDRGVGFTLAQPPHVGEVQTVRWMNRHTPHSVAGVNGDFFDIGETGAPLGLGVKNGEVEHGINLGWNQAFWLDRNNQPHIGIVPMHLVAPRYPHLGATNLNSPQVRPGGIGVYDGRWGETSGWAWTQGQRKNVLMAHVVDHRIAGFQHKYAAGQRIIGKYLVARGWGAVRRLRRLHVGDPIWFAANAAHQPRMALTGNAILLSKGRVVATDNTELHPRTAVGIDPYHHWVFLLVVEGRQEFSDGYTMVEEARKLKRLGCKSALNLDGGGSTTLVAQRSHTWQLLNSPSDGQPRRVGNGLSVTYHRPRRRHR